MGLKITAQNKYRYKLMQTSRRGEGEGLKDTCRSVPRWRPNTGLVVLDYWEERMVQKYPVFLSRLHYLYLYPEGSLSKSKLLFASLCQDASWETSEVSHLGPNLSEGQSYNKMMNI